MSGATKLFIDWPNVVIMWHDLDDSIIISALNLEFQRILQVLHWSAAEQAI